MSHTAAKVQSHCAPWQSLLVPYIPHCLTHAPVALSNEHHVPPPRASHGVLPSDGGQMIGMHDWLALYHSQLGSTLHVTSSVHWHGACRHVPSVAFHTQWESDAHVPALVDVHSASPHEPDLENHSHSGSLLHASRTP